LAKRRITTRSITAPTTMPIATPMGAAMAQGRPWPSLSPTATPAAMLPIAL
jgi:hypothetical protein